MWNFVRLPRIVNLWGHSCSLLGLFSFQNAFLVILVFISFTDLSVSSSVTKLPSYLYERKRDSFDLYFTLRGATTPMQNFITIHDTITPFRPQICENAHHVTAIVFWFFLLPIAKTLAPIFTIITSMTSFRASTCLLGHPKQKVTFRPNFLPKTQIFRQFLTRLRRFRVKTA